MAHGFVKHVMFGLEAIIVLFHIVDNYRVLLIKERFQRGSQHAVEETSIIRILLRVLEIIYIQNYIMLFILAYIKITILCYFSYGTILLVILIVLLGFLSLFRESWLEQLFNIRYVLFCFLFYFILVRWSFTSTTRGGDDKRVRRSPGIEPRHAHLSEVSKPIERALIAVAIFCSLVHSQETKPPATKNVKPQRHQDAPKRSQAPADYNFKVANCKRLHSHGILWTKLKLADVHFSRSHQGDKRLLASLFRILQIGYHWLTYISDVKWNKLQMDLAD